MGTKLTCVQVYLGDKEKAPSRALVLDAVRRHLGEGSYVETGPDEAPDREVFVGPLGEAPWLTVIDPQGDAREMARALSAATAGTTVLINLMDSVVIHLRRYSQAAVVDDYCNEPQSCDLYGPGPGGPPYWGKQRGKALKARTRGDLACWRDLLVEGTDMQKLRETWDSDPVFADDILWATADALAMNKGEIDADFLSGSQGFTRLTFRQSDLPPYRVKAEGPPRLTLAGWTELQEVYAGEQLDVAIYIQNDGGASRGLDILAWGSAVEQGIVALDKAVAVRQADLLRMATPGSPPSLPGEELPFALRRATPGDEEVQALVASSATLELPQGIVGGLQVLAQPGASWQKAGEALSQTRHIVRVLGAVKKIGNGELFIGFVPQANWEGQVVYRASLRALPTPRQPLRARQSERPLSPVSAQQLERPSQLFALMSLGADREQSAQAAADAVEAWVARVTKNKSDRLTVHLGTRLNLMPSRERFAAAEIPTSERWQALRRGLGSCLSLTIRRGAASILFDRNTLFFQMSREEPVPHVGFWFNATALDAGALEAARAWLAGIVDRLMVEAAGLQAMIGAWEWWRYVDPLPQFVATPYEAACGIGGQCTAAQSWCRRFLRGVTEQVWLGPELVARLGGTAKLAPVAAVTPVGDGVRVSLNRDASLDALEEVLAPLLPSERDWREGMERLYPATGWAAKPR